MAQIDLVLEQFQRNSRGKEWRKEFLLYLQDLRQQNHSNLDICHSLIESVDQEYLPPVVFGIFLSWSKSLDCIVLCLRHSTSPYIRHQGIKHFGKALADVKEWELAWRSVGGTIGLVDIFSASSVMEVKTLVRTIGYCNRYSHKCVLREKAIEELLYALLPSHYPGSKLKSDDKRRLKNHYAQMLPACSPEFVEKLFDSKDRSNPLYSLAPSKRLVKTHRELLKKRVVDAIFGDGCKDDDLYQYINTFACHLAGPNPDPNDPKVSVSMAFTTKLILLQSRLTDFGGSNLWPNGISEFVLFTSLLKRSIRKRLPKDKLHNLILLGLQLLEAKPKLQAASEAKYLWSTVISQWRRQPALYKDSLVFALRLNLGGSQKTIGRDYVEVSRTLHAKPELRWPLLQLFCQYVPRKGIDLDSNNNFEVFAKQDWPAEIFYLLNKEQAIRLLKGLRDASPHYNFLSDLARGSILSTKNIITQRNFNVTLLLTILQRDSEEAQQLAANAVEELRKSAATRQQIERAELATAASAYAIASGNLDIYGETATWLQRFARDPPSVRMIFDPDSMLTKEGINLLSGIPEPLPENTELVEIKSRVDKANEILMTFHETMLIAKREPSFNAREWTSVMSLFSAVIRQRVTSSKELQKRLRNSDVDLYTSVWASTFAMLEEISVEILNSVYGSLKELLNTLPPTALAATIKTMLDSGNEKRQRKADRQPADDVLERLTYEILLRLAKSENPKLAQQLILQTIIDRPDASSWHRELLSIQFMNSLPAKDAHEMLSAFATAIGEKLEEQSYIKVGEAQPLPSKSSQPLVKVTTVKYLAQILDGAEFISTDTSVEILLELFKVGTHKDIRFATLESLLSLLNNLCSGAEQNWKSNPLIERIFGVLETIIPVVGSVNESRPPRAEDWQEVKKSGKLPDISLTLPPLFECLLSAAGVTKYGHCRWPGLKKLRAEFVSRLLLPILEYSQTEHQKWIALFLIKYKVGNLALSDLPLTPIAPDVWDILVKNYLDLIPSTVLENFHEYIVMTISPPAALRDLNSSFKSNADMLNLPEVQHWHSIFGLQSTYYEGSRTQRLVHLIKNDRPQSLIPYGITFDKVLDMIISQISLILDNYENLGETKWNRFTNDIRHPKKAMYIFEDDKTMRSMVSRWQTTGRLILERVIELITEKKNKNAREHKRTALPSIMKLRLWLLPYPCFPDPQGIDSQCKTFVNELEALLDSFLQGETSLLHWPKIVKDSLTISESLNTPEEQLCIALHLGQFQTTSPNAFLDEKTSALNLVKLGLVMKLIEQGAEGFMKSRIHGVVSELGKEIMKGLKKMVEDWSESEDEEVRDAVQAMKGRTGVFSEFWKISMEDE